MEVDSDFLQQYRNITNKLKKRFLKKPNVAEGSEQFASLSKLLRAQECHQYAGFCQLAQARCEHMIGNWCAEAYALTEAARSFLLSEHSVQDIHCPSFQEHLNAAINCYSHAIRVFLENKLCAMAAALSIELGNSLKTLGRPGEAVQHYHRAAELQLQNPLECLDSLGRIASAKIMIGDYEGALCTMTEMDYLAHERGVTTSDGLQPIGAFADILARCEVSRVLLLLLLQPTPQRIRPEHAQILEKYSWESSDDDINASCISEDLFLLLQSLVMACQSRDTEALKCHQTELWPLLSSEQNHLLHLVLEEVAHPSSQVI